MKKVALASALFLASYVSFAQPKSCATSQVMQQFYEQYPETKEQVSSFYSQMDNSVYNGPKAVRYIPVVFHVIYNNASENISDALVNECIDQLNEDYRKQNSDFSSTRTQFQSVAADCEIMFCLATTDPNGNPTTGINRSQTNKTNWSVSSETNDMKSPAGNDGGVSPWNFRRYMNVWVVDLADYSPSTGGTAGYAYLPGFGSQWEAIDGIVVDYQAIGTGDRTLTHEVGHYLGLSHPWEDENGNASCNPGDGISDTPPTDQATYNCPASQTRCGGNLTQWENYMDYSFCSTMFTTQQSNRMNTILSTTYGIGTPGRGQLTGWGGCQATSTTLEAIFTGSPTTVSAGGSVTFTDQSTGSPTSWNWTFPGGNPSSFSGQNPPPIVYSTPGTYNVTLTVSDGSGTDTQTNTNYIVVTQGGGGGGTGCDTLFYFEGLYFAVDPSVSSNFDINVIDEDGLTPNDALGFTSSNWGTFYDLIAPGDTDFYQLATSWFNDPGQSDNWIIFGPLQAGTQSSTLSWFHLIPDNDFRDGYRVLATTAGNTVNDFGSATVLKNFSDNDPLTDGDTTWTFQSANLPASFNGQQVYIAFHHNATDMFLLGLDEFIFSKCDASTAPTLNADFFANPTNLQVGQSTNFTDLSTGNITSWNWTFNGGSPSSFSGQNPPAVTYNAVGLYTVSLTVSDGTNSDTETKSFYIDVSQTVTTVDDTCFLRFGTDFQFFFVDSVDQATFNPAFYDLDAQTPPTQINPPYNGNWQLFYEILSPGDTNYYLSATSWFTAAPPVAADNWFTVGPITVQNDTVVVSWFHRYALNDFRDGYRVLATTLGPTPQNFQTLSIPLFQVTDNDATTNNDTVWTYQEVTINATPYVGSQVWLAIHHNATDQFIVDIDDLLVEDCDTVNTSTVITNLGSSKNVEEVQFLPNPSNGLFYLKYRFDTYVNLNVTLTDAVGRLVYNKQANHTHGGLLEVNLENQPAGVYFATVRAGEKIFVQKLVLTR